MTTITIRNVSDEVRDELAARARRSGRSLQEFLLRELTGLASRPSLDEVVARARDRVRATGTRVEVADVISDLDADRA